MAVPQYVFAELVRESCTATGTGVLALGGALPGHRRFADAVSVGAAFCYTVAGVTDPAQWECGIGQIDAQGRLVRSGVSANQNGAGMTGGSIGAEAVGAASLRQFASEWGGPRPAGAGSRTGSGRGDGRGGPAWCRRAVGAAGQAAEVVMARPELAGEARRRRIDDGFDSAAALAADGGRAGAKGSDPQ